MVGGVWPSDTVERLLGAHFPREARWDTYKRRSFSSLAPSPCATKVSHSLPHRARCRSGPPRTHEPHSQIAVSRPVTLGSMWVLICYPNNSGTSSWTRFSRPACPNPFAFRSRMRTETYQPCWPASVIPNRARCEPHLTLTTTTICHGYAAGLHNLPTFHSLLLGFPSLCHYPSASTSQRGLSNTLLPAGLREEPRFCTTPGGLVQHLSYH